jgi:hypothetical protein
MDILIPTYHADFIWLEYCLKSIKKFASGFRNIIIISDNDGHIIPDATLNIIKATVIYKDLPKTWPSTIKHRPGYLWQQVLKLNWMEYTDADSILILDSDEMLTRNVNPEYFKDENGKFQWLYRDWEFAEGAKMWAEPTEKFLKVKPPYEAMCCAPFVLERETTINFIEYVKKIHNSTNEYDAFFKYNAELFSEYNAYGNYVLLFENGKKYSSLINYSGERTNIVLKSWSYGGLSEDDKTRRQQLLKDS